MDGRNTGRMGFSHAAEDSAENMMAAVKAGQKVSFTPEEIAYIKVLKEKAAASLCNTKGDFT